MQTDRELLELAAKAYWGDEIDDVVSVEWSEQDASILYTHGENQDHNGSDRAFLWNPLEEDADALQLAVKLGMEVSVAFAQVYPCRFGMDDGREINEPFGEAHGPDALDRYAATRRAIVRAAASVGGGNHAD